MAERVKSSGGKASRTKSAGKASGSASAGASRVRKHREKMKALGLKPVTMWLPDVTAPGYLEDIRRQCLLLKNDPHEQTILMEIEHLSDDDGWK